MDVLNESSEDELCPAGADGIRPYQYEPLVRDVVHRNRQNEYEKCESSDDEDTASTDIQEAIQDQQRLDNLAWCDCDNCGLMPTNHECICCCEIDPVAAIIDEQNLTCITEHEGFIGNCLNRYVIQVSLFEYVHIDGPVDDNEPIHELYRYIAYRRFTRWIWHTLGKGRRKVIPSCAVRKIREAFPSEVYTGFTYLRP